MQKTLIRILLFFIFIGYVINNENKFSFLKKYYKKIKRKEGAIILSNGNHAYEGNVEIFHGGIWGNVCDDEWDIEDGEVVCRQLGYKGVRKVTHDSFFGEVTGKFLMDNVYCTGREKHLSKCHFEGWGLSDCGSAESAGVICDESEMLITINATPSQPKTKISIKNMYKIEYDSNDSDDDMSNGNNALTLLIEINNEVKKQNIKLFSDNEELISTRTTKRKRYWVHQLFKKRIIDREFQRICIGLRSYPDKFFSYYRMNIDTYNYILQKIEPHITKYSNRPSISPSERLSVTLRFLSTGMSYQALSHDFLMDAYTISLIVKEEKQDLIHSNFHLRITGGRGLSEGRVEVKYGNSDWGVICGNGWGLLEANSVCRSLGLGHAHSAVKTDFFGGNTSKILLSDVQCKGTEVSLADCSTSITSRECSGNRNHIAGVVCSNALPDLIIDSDELEQSTYIEDKQLFYLQCAMEENCLSSSAYKIRRNKILNWHLTTRRLLRFTAKITNIGKADFRPSIPKNLWEFHQCHMHYHSMEVFATFDILDQGGTKVAEGHKASFCLEDNQCTTGVEPKFSCANFGDQGISINCSDIYKHTLDCQWVDITDLVPGIYTFQVTVNPEFKIGEMSFGNNMATCSMHYTETHVRIHDCILQHP